MMSSSMQFSWIIKQIFKVELEPSQSDGSGSSQIPRLRLWNPDTRYRKPDILFSKKPISGKICRSLETDARNFLLIENETVQWFMLLIINYEEQNFSLLVLQK